MGNPRSVKALYIVKQKGRNSYDSEGNPGAGAVEGRFNKWYLKLKGTVEYVDKMVGEAVSVVKGNQKGSSNVD